MTESEFITIGIHIKGRIIDLKVPNLATKGRLKRIITEALSEMRIHLPTGFELSLIGKPLVDKKLASLDSYGFGDGEQIEIVLESRNNHAENI